jgi:Ca-activated chloride channel family protein
MKNTKLNFCRFWLLLIVAAAASFPVSAQTEDKTLSPYFFVKGDPNVDHLPLKDTNVTISVTGVIADVSVKQIYRNEGIRPINASYIFPASTRAAVYAMRMKIGDQVIVAKIKEREAAKKDFEDAEKQGKSASLLEENRPNVFSMKLANIMPNEQIEIELRYTELLVPTDGIYELVYPTVVGPRYPSNDSKGGSDRPVSAGYFRQGVRPTSALRISTQISAGVPIEELTCATHEIVPEWQGRTVARLNLNDADPFQGNRDFILRYRLAGAAITSGLILFESEGENFFLYMAQPPRQPKIEAIPPREYIFVVDVSGSMYGFPLDTSKRLLEDLIGKLRPTDYFNIVLFSGDSTVLSDKPLAANQENISLALQLIDRQRGSGGTELLPAIKQAMALPHPANTSRNIVVVTDGYISGEDNVFEYIRGNLDECNVFAFGIGSSVNRYLIEGIAKAGMGEPFVITEPKEAEAIATRFREYIQTPVLTGIKVEPVGFDAYDVYPEKIPDMFALRPIILFGKWRGPAAGTFELRGTTGLGDYSASLDVADFKPNPNNVALRYLWARTRIAELSDYGTADVDERKQQEITALGIKYNLLTRYTSFIAVREQIVNPDGSAENVNQPLPLPLGVSDMAVGSEPELIWLFGIIALIAAVVLVRRHAGLIQIFANRL